MVRGHERAVKRRARGASLYIPSLLAAFLCISLAPSATAHLHRWPPPPLRLATLRPCSRTCDVDLEPHLHPCLSQMQPAHRRLRQMQMSLLRCRPSSRERAPLRRHRHKRRSPTGYATSCASLPLLLHKHQSLASRVRLRPLLLPPLLGRASPTRAAKRSKRSTQCWRCSTSTPSTPTPKPPSTPRPTPRAMSSSCGACNPSCCCRGTADRCTVLACAARVPDHELALQGGCRSVGRGGRCLARSPRSRTVLDPLHADTAAPRRHAALTQATMIDVIAPLAGGWEEMWLIAISMLQVAREVQISRECSTSSVSSSSASKPVQGERENAPVAVRACGHTL